MGARDWPRKKRKKGRWAAKLLCVLAGLCCLALFVLPLAAVKLLTAGPVTYGEPASHPLQKIYTAADFDLHAEERMLLTADGYSIWTAEVYAEQPKAVVIYLTGIRQPSVTYYYGHSKWLLRQGYASMLLEVRGHGRSDGDRVCLGYEEVEDVRAAVAYLRAQERYSGVPIVLHGVSMGGAIAINAFGELREVDGLIAMSAYSSFTDVLQDTLRGYGVPDWLGKALRPGSKLALRLEFGAENMQMEPVSQVKKIGSRSALFVAAAGDAEVPPENMRRLLDAAPAHCEGWLRETPRAGHFIVLDHEFERIDTDAEYCGRILAFLESVAQN